MASAAQPAARTDTSMRTLLRSTGVVAGIRGLDFGLSFLVSVLLAGRFGASGQLDAFFLARRTTVGFADTIRKLVGQVVLPPVIAAVDRGEAPSVHALPRRIWWFLGVFALLMFTGTLVPSILVSAFAPGFTGARHDLAATMMAIMMPLLPIAVVASLLAAVLQAKQRYLLSEGTNLVQRAILVAVLALLVPPLGIVAGAWTMLASGAVGLAILFAGAWSLVRHRPASLAGAGRSDAPLATDAAAPAPPGGTLGGGLVAAIVINVYYQATALMDFAWASTAASGSVAALEYGARLVSLVPGLVMSSLYTVLLPELVRAVRDPDPVRAAAGIQRYQRIAFFGQLPVSVGMMLGAPIMVGALFGHGAFDARGIGLAASATAGYAAAAIFLAPFGATTSAIYADPRGPCLRDLSIIAGGGLALRAGALAIATPAWGVAGIAWAAALSTLLGAVLAQAVAVRRFKGFDMSEQLRDFAASALCAAVATAAGWCLLAIVPSTAGLVGQLARLAGLGAVILATYAAAGLALRVPEVAAVRDIIGKRLRKRRKA